MLARADAWLSAERVRRLARLMVIIQSALFAFFVAGSHGAFTDTAPQTVSDFASFYAAGELADQGRAEAAYDPAAHKAAVAAISGPDAEYRQIFLNPPVFLLVCAPLALLPFLLAFVLFVATTGLVWLALCTRIAGGGRLATLVLASVPSLYWALGWGQNSFVSAGLMAAGTLLLATRPALAGAAFGALCFKPHFAILLPVALLAGRQYRAIAGGILSSVGLVALSAALFGLPAWRAFADLVRHARDTIENGQILLAGHVDPGGAARLLGLGQGAAWTIQTLASVVSATIVAIAWRRPVKAEVRYATLIAGTIVAMPFLLFYDLVMAAVAASWLVRVARQDGFLPAEKPVFAILILADLLAYPLARETPFAVGAIVGPGVLALALRRAWWHPKPGAPLPL